MTTMQQDPATLRLVAGRARAVDMQPYLGTALFAMKPVRETSIDTLGVDAQWRMYWNPDFVATLSVEECAGAWLHEVGHLLRSHRQRFDALLEPQNRHPLWNMACFPAGTLLPNGVPIENVATMVRDVDEDLVKIRSTAGTVAATTEHPFYVRKRLNKRSPIRMADAAWIEASDLAVGDYLCVPIITEKRGDQSIDLSGFVMDGRDTLGRDTFGNRAVKSLPLTPDTAWLIGLWVAEGSASPAARFSLNASETDIADKIDKIAAGLGYAASRSLSPTGTSMQVSIHTTVFGRWLKEMCGPSAATKHIPEVILRHYDRDVRAAFLRGLLDGDGTHRATRSNAAQVPYEEIRVASKALVTDTLLLLAQDGIGCHVSEGVQPPREIAGRALPESPVYRIAWNPEGARPTTRLLNGKEVTSYSHRWKADEDGVWYPITKVDSQPYTGPVYNMTTPSHTYIAAGYLVHNCDAAINADLREASVPLPAIKAVYPERIPGGQAGMTAEQFYRLILDTPEAEKVSGQREDLRLLPNALILGKTEGQRIIAMTRAGFLDNNDFAVSVTAADDTPVAVRDGHVHDRRTCAFVIDEEMPAGEYLVTVTSGGTTVTAPLLVVAPSIRLRPDHIVSGWTAPYKVTVVGQFTEFTPNAVATVHDEEGNLVAVSETTHVSQTYLTFEIAEQVADGTYVVTVTDGPTTVEATLPIGLPFMDISPNALPVGHGTPYPFAAVVDDFTFDATTTFELFLPVMGALIEIPDALDNVTVKTSAAADFALTVSLDEGQYLVVATTGGERAVATLTVSQGSGEGEGEGEGSGSGESEGDGSGDGEGSVSGSGESEGDGSGSSDCGSGAGGPARPWDRGGDTTDGSVDEGRGNLIREQTAREIQNHAKTRGTVPGGWGRWANEILKPQVDWRKELRSVVRRTCATVAGMRDYTYQRPSRRTGAVPNVIFPALRAPRPPKAAVVVDTSGSVSDKMLGQAIGDMTALLKQVQAGGGDALSLIACDAAAAEMKSLRSMKNLTSLEGGGGTDMRVGIEAAAALNPKVDLIITFTDGETPWPEAPPLANPRAKYVVVLLAGETSGQWAPPEWMHVITVDDAYLRGDR